MSAVTTPSGEKRQNSGSTDAPTRDKRLKTIACDRCRRRKVKCDGDGYNQIPCKYCVSVSLDCTYGQKTGRTSSANNQSSKSNRQTGRNSVRSKTSNVTTPADNIAVTTGVSTTSSRQRNTNTNTNQNTKQTSKKSSTSSNMIRRIVPQILPIPDTKANDYEYTIKLFTSMTLKNENQIRQKLKNYVQIPQVEESSSPSRPQQSAANNNNSNSNSNNNTLLEDTHLIGNLVDLYFKNFHPLLPVLHKAYFMERFNNDKGKSMSQLLLCAVCAIGSCYTNNLAARKDINNPYTAGLPFYEYAREMVYRSIDFPRLSTATALFLLGTFDALRSLQSRIYVGMATTLAITMRIHDKHSFPENLSVNKRDARKRLWWGIAITNNLHCITLNRMLALKDNNNCNMEYPTENCDDDTESKIIEYYKNYLTITKIIYDVLENSLNENYTMINNLEEELNKWKRELPSYLKIDDVKGLDVTYNETKIEHLRIYLCVLYNYAIIRIHHPNIKSSPSLEACTRAANVITLCVNENFVNIINSKQFIIHCVLCAGFIHIFNLDQQQSSKDSRKNVATTIKFFQNVLKEPSLHQNHYGIKNSIAIFASQLEGIPDVEDYITEIVRTSLNLISGNSNSNEKTLQFPNSVTVNEESNSMEESKNINNNNNNNGNNSNNNNNNNSSSNNNNNNNSNNHSNNNNVNDSAQDNSLNEFKKLSPIQNSQPINILAQTAATRSHFNNNNSPISHGPSGQQSQSQTQSIFPTTPVPLDPPVTTTKIDSSLMPEVNYSSTHYQTRQQHDNTSTWPQSHYNHYHHLHPIQNQSHQTTMSPTGNEQTMMVINNSNTSPPLRTISMTSPSSSLPPLHTNTAFTSPHVQFSYPSALPSMNSMTSMSYFSTSQHQQSQHSSQSYNTSTPSTIGISGSFVGNDMSSGLAPMTGMMGNGGSVTNGMISTSENSVSMLIDNQGSSTNELDAQQHHQHHHQHHQPRRTSQPYYFN